ncbi:MAG TPA: FAD-binding oxidoreductase [Candidatus Elarobacter sp.]|nr:FAD-binding oxidoreductase [Candidatus Elarobacter sp.]
MTSPVATPALEESFRGALVRPGEPGYDAARAVWNGMIDKRPALIARCTGVADVVAAIRFARENELAIAVRGGGHNVAGTAVCDGGIVIDLSPMKGVHVDPVRRIAHVQGGVTWGELDRATQAYGLATPGGLISSTGVAGLTLGGGFGWLSRAYGLASDNLLSVDIVDAEGRLLTASAGEHRDLFWAVRGGGGNFGVVTSFTFTLHPLGPVVFGGVAFHRADAAGEMLRAYRDVTASLPESVTSALIFLTGPPAPFLPPELHGAPLIAIAGLYAGDASKGERATRPLRELGTAAVDLFHELPYTALQTMFDATAPAGLQNYWKSHAFAALDDGAVTALAASGVAMPSPLSHVDLHHLGGAVSRPADDATAYPLRGAEYVVNVVGTWPDPADSARQVAWVRDVWDALRPSAADTSYVNFLADTGPEQAEPAYGATTYARLGAVKRTYDPQNIFRGNVNVAPR